MERLFLCNISVQFQCWKPATIYPEFTVTHYFVLHAISLLFIYFLYLIVVHEKAADVRS